MRAAKRPGGTLAVAQPNNIIVMARASRASIGVWEIMLVWPRQRVRRRARSGANGGIGSMWGRHGREPIVLEM